MQLLGLGRFGFVLLFISLQGFFHSHLPQILWSTSLAAVNQGLCERVAAAVRCGNAYLQTAFFVSFFFSESLNSHKSGCFGFSTELLPLIVPHDLSSVWNEALLFEYVLEERQVVKVRSLLTVGIHKLLHWLSPQICLVQGSV